MLSFTDVVSSEHRLLSNILKRGPFSCKGDERTLLTICFTMMLNCSVAGLFMALDALQERGMSYADFRWGNPDECRFPLFNFLKPVALPWMVLVYLVMVSGECLKKGVLYARDCRICLMTPVHWRSLPHRNLSVFRCLWYYVGPVLPQSMCSIFSPVLVPVLLG